MRIARILGTLLLLAVVVIALFSDQLNLSPPIGSEKIAYTDRTSIERGAEKFKRMNGDTWLSERGVPEYSDHCIGCPPYGDVNAYHNTENRTDLTEYTYGANCGEKANGDVLERSEKTDQNGNVIGKRCVVRMGGETRVFWTDGNEFWIIGAPTTEIAKEFEVSDEYARYRAERLQYVREIMKGAVANTSNPK